MDLLRRPSRWLIGLAAVGASPAVLASGGDPCEPDGVVDGNLVIRLQDGTSVAAAWRSIFGVQCGWMPAASQPYRIALA